MLSQYYLPWLTPVICSHADSKPSAVSNASTSLSVLFSPVIRARIEAGRFTLFRPSSVCAHHNIESLSSEAASIISVRDIFAPDIRILIRELSLKPTASVASVVAGMIWAVLPAIFKAVWNTNETLFTLMMNYVATQLVAWFLKQYVESGSGVMDTMPQYGLPVIGEQKYLLNVILVALLTVLVYIYLKHSKQGYEITVVGESENTARYIGINVKKVVIRTMLISGALCGVAGLLLVGGTNHTISATTIDGRGFTAIMVSWLAKFNPMFMVLTTFLVIFLQLGSKQLTSDFGISSSIADISTGIILLFIIGCEFFLQYRIVFSKTRKGAAK